MPLSQVGRTVTVFTLGSSRSFDHGLDNCRLMAVEFWLLSFLTMWRDKCKSMNVFNCLFNQTNHTRQKVSDNMKQNPL